MKKTYFASLAVLALLALTPAKAGRLSDLIESEGLGWMMGSWTSTIDAGELLLVYTMELDGNVITVHFKSPDMESKGMIGMKPGSDDVVYGTMNSRGGAGMGKWEDVDGHPALKLNSVSADGEERTMVFVHRKTGDDTMTVDVHDVDDSGSPSSSPVWSLDWTRKQS